MMNTIKLDQIFQKIDEERKAEPIPVRSPNMVHMPRIQHHTLGTKNDEPSKKNEFYEDVGDPIAGIRHRFSNATPMKKREMEERIGEMETVYRDGVDGDTDMQQWERTQKLGLFSKQGLFN